MARESLREYLYSTLTGNASLLTLLGPVSAANRRVYSAWPQTQPKLTGAGDPPEGWLVFWEDPTAQVAGEICEQVTWRMLLCATRFTLADAILDILDTYWNWTLHQQKLVAIDNYYLLMAKRVKVVDAYNAEFKLYERQVSYWMELVKSPAEVLA